MIRPIAPSRAVALAAMGAASRDLSTVPPTARVAVALWDLGGAAPTSRVADELRADFNHALGWLLNARYEFLYYARGEWWLNAKGTELVGRVFAHYRDLRQEVAA